MTGAGSDLEVVLITDPLVDDDSQRVVRRLPGCRRVEGTLSRDGLPRGSRSVFVLSREDLDAGGLETHIDVLVSYGIAARRVVGDHRAVRRANRRLGYV
jgi:hypothetical protein